MPADTLYVSLMEGTNPQSFGFMMFQMIGMLILISIVLYLSLFFFKKINAKYKNKNQFNSLKIHENVYFSTKQGLSVVSFGEKVYIVGFSNNSVNLIDKIEDEQVISSLKEKKQKINKFSDFFKM